MSRCDVVYRSATQTLEIICQVFIDDFEDAIREPGGAPLHLMSEREVEDAHQLMEKYLNAQLTLDPGSGHIALQLLGKEMAGDPLAMRLYIMADSVALRDELTIRNAILCELFVDQKNVTTFQVDDSRKQFYILDKKQPEITIPVQ